MECEAKQRQESQTIQLCIYSGKENGKIPVGKHFLVCLLLITRTGIDRTSFDLMSG
jgi:hypothetical protein